MKNLRIAVKELVSKNAELEKFDKWLDEVEIVDYLVFNGDPVYVKYGQCGSNAGIFVISTSKSDAEERYDEAMENYYENVDPFDGDFEDEDEEGAAYDAWLDKHNKKEKNFNTFSMSSDELKTLKKKHKFDIVNETRNDNKKTRYLVLRFSDVHSPDIKMLNKLKTSLKSVTKTTWSQGHEDDEDVTSHLFSEISKSVEEQEVEKMLKQIYNTAKEFAKQLKLKNIDAVENWK